MLYRQEITSSSPSTVDCICRQWHKHQDQEPRTKYSQPVNFTLGIWGRKGESNGAWNYRRFTRASLPATCFWVFLGRRQNKREVNQYLSPIHPSSSSSPNGCRAISTAISSMSLACGCTPFQNLSSHVRLSTCLIQAERPRLPPEICASNYVMQLDVIRMQSETCKLIPLWNRGHKKIRIPPALKRSKNLLRGGPVVFRFSNSLWSNLAFSPGLLALSFREYVMCLPLFTATLSLSSFFMSVFNAFKRRRDGSLHIPSQPTRPKVLANQHVRKRVKEEQLYQSSYVPF